MTLEGTGVGLELRRISSLLPHEETIPEHVDLLAEDIERVGVQKDPLIIDAESGTVLDGMHRLAALAKLELRTAVCFPVDYRSAAVGLNRWARIYSMGRNGRPAQVVNELGFIERRSLNEAMDALASRQRGMAALIGEGAYVPAAPARLEETLGLVRELDELCRELRWGRSFVAEDEVGPALKGPGIMALLVQRFTKEDVLDAARTGRLFPCKTSMHTVDPRPVSVNFPTKDLAWAPSEGKGARLSRLGTRLLPPNSVYGGRKYKERLLVLSAL